MRQYAALLAATTAILCACAPLDRLQTPAEPPSPPPSTEPEGDPQGERPPPEAKQTETPEVLETPEVREVPETSQTPQAPEPSDAAETREEPEPTLEPEDASTPPVEKEPVQPGDSSTAAAPSPPATANTTLSGRISLTGGSADPREAVVYFIPDDGVEASDRDDEPQNIEIVTRDKALRPTVLPVSRGTRISFPNKDPILHNLFSVSPKNDFDFGVYGPGESPSVTLDNTGVVNVYCNVHHDMHAHVLVVDTPWRTQPNVDGRFRLDDLPTGPGQLHIWHRQSDRWSRAIDLPVTGALEATLEITKPSLPAHRDKAGQPYNRRNRDPYR